MKLSVYYSIWSILLLSCVFLIALAKKKGQTNRRYSSILKNRIKFEQSVSSNNNDDRSAYSLGSLWEKSLSLAMYEQEVEDINAEHRSNQFMERRLIVMPLSDAFQNNKADPMYGKIQYGDKCSLPSSLGKQIFEKRYEVPWLFEIKPVRNFKNIVEGDIESMNSVRSETIFDSALQKNKTRLNVAYLSPLDFRAPENFIFLPNWMLRDMDLKPFDIVDISMVKIKLASLVKLQPLTPAWDELVEQGNRNPKSLLEHELNKYSSLTCGSTIGINVDGREYNFYVNETIAEGDVAAHAVRVQDSDIRTDIDRSVLDKILEKQKKQDKEIDALKASTATTKSNSKKKTKKPSRQ